MEQQVLAWITQYGYLAIFSLLVFGIVGLPVPDETLLTFTGYLVYQGHLSLPLAFLSGFCRQRLRHHAQLYPGTHLRPQADSSLWPVCAHHEEHVEKAHAWFARVGHWSLTFGYFVPGVRHFTAYAAGMSDLEYPHRSRCSPMPARRIWVGHLHRPRLLPGRALEGGAAEPRSLPGGRHHRRRHSWAWRIWRGESGSGRSRR